MALDNNLICGTQGWQQPDWCDAYYTDECPADWRFAYYSSLHRSSWVPASFWQQPAPAMQQFVEDSDEGFYFVFELAQNWQQTVNQTLDVLAAIKPQVACLVVPVSDDGLDQSRLKAAKNLAKQYSLALDMSSCRGDSSGLEQLAKQENWSIVCYADQQAAVDSGDFLPMVTAEKDLRQLRVLIEQAAAWMGEARSAGIYMAPHAESPEVAQQARELAEIMGVA